MLGPAAIGNTIRPEAGITGAVALLVAIAGFLWETAHGQSGNEFAIVAAAWGLGYLGGLLWLRWRG